MRVTDLDAQIPDQIGHAFGYYDYGEEIGMRGTANDETKRLAMRWSGDSKAKGMCRDRSWALERAWNL